MDISLANNALTDLSLMQARTPLPNAEGAKNAQAIDKAAKDFEAVFVGQMLEHMFAGIETDPMFGGGSGEKIFRSMQVQEYAKIITEKGGIGIADAMKAEMINMQAQEVPQP